MTKLAFASLWLLVFSIPWQNAVVIPELGTISRLVGALVVGFTILAVVCTRRIRPFRLLQALMLAFLCWAVVASTWSIDPVISQDRVTTYLQLVVMVLAMWELSATPERQKGLMKAFVLGAAVPGVGIVWNRIAGVSFEGRYHAVGMGINELGYTFVMALAMGCYLAATERKTLHFWGYSVLLGLFQVGVLLTASRGATLASLVAWMFLPWVFVRLKAYKKSAAVLLGGALVAAAIALVPASAWQRLSETGEQIETGSFSRRGPIWEAGWEVFQRHPITGVGLGSFPKSVSAKLPQAMSPHNVFLSISVELGLIGFALFCALLVCLFVGCLHMPLFDRRLGLILMMTFMMTAMAANWEYKKTTWFMFCLLAAQVGSRIRLGGSASRLAPLGANTQAQAQAVAR
jgi:O-antigen ligase